MKVKSGIPIPETPSRRRYPFDQLAVDDSVEFDSTEDFERARRAAQSYGRTHKLQFAARKGIQDGVYVGKGGTIWRTK